MTTIDIEVPRHIWKGRDVDYHKWIWETYGRYIKPGQEINLRIRLSWR